MYLIVFEYMFDFILGGGELSLDILYMGFPFVEKMHFYISFKLFCEGFSYVLDSIAVLLGG